jgi:hypothetical protein
MMNPGRASQYSEHFRFIAGVGLVAHELLGDPPSRGVTGRMRFEPSKGDAIASYHQPDQTIAKIYQTIAKYGGDKITVRFSHPGAASASGQGGWNL